MPIVLARPASKKEAHHPPNDIVQFLVAIYFSGRTLFGIEAEISVLRRCCNLISLASLIFR
jgi:hypothetical protein